MGNKNLSEVIAYKSIFSMHKESYYGIAN